jgi:peptidoglycan/LPS O-acetylase OafA/YrhL
VDVVVHLRAATFVILMSASTGDRRRFVISRLVRLYPAFWACCTITFLATVAFGGSRFHAAPAQYVANMDALERIYERAIHRRVYWSLAVELQFHALFGDLSETRLVR